MDEKAEWRVRHVSAPLVDRAIVSGASEPVPCIYDTTRITQNSALTHKNPASGVLVMNAIVLRSTEIEEQNEETENDRKEKRDDDGRQPREALRGLRRRTISTTNTGKLTANIKS